MFDVIMNFKKEEIVKLYEKLNIKLILEEKEFEGKLLLKVIMKKWFLVGEVLFQMIIIYLFFFVRVQKYRMELFYEGFLDDFVVFGIKNCDFQVSDNVQIGFQRIFWLVKILCFVRVYNIEKACQCFVWVKFLLYSN